MIGFLKIIVSILGITACVYKETPFEKMYKVLEQVAMDEKDFEQVQDPLVAAEKEEKETYDKLIKLTANQIDQKRKLVDDAENLVKKRKNYMDTETRSLRNSEKEFEKVVPLKDEIEDKKLRKQADDLYQLMIARYNAHDDLSTEYLYEAAQDLQLYEMFKDKNVSVEQLEVQVQKVNGMYKKIYTANDRFNSLTQQYNEKKLQFYKSAALVKE